MDYNKTYEKNFDEDLSKRLKQYVSSVIETLINSVLCYRKMFIIHLSTQMTKKDLLKHRFQSKIDFIIIWQWK